MGGHVLRRTFKNDDPLQKKSRDMGWGAIAGDFFHTISVLIEFKILEYLTRNVEMSPLRMLVLLRALSSGAPSSSRRPLACFLR